MSLRILNFQKPVQPAELFAHAAMRQLKAQGDSVGPDELLKRLSGYIGNRCVTEVEASEVPLLIIRECGNAAQTIKRFDVLKALAAISGAIQFLLGVTLTNPLVLGTGLLSCILSFNALVRNLSPSAALLVWLLYSESRKNTTVETTRTRLRKIFEEELPSNQSATAVDAAFEVGLSELADLGVAEASHDGSMIRLKEAVYARNEDVIS